MNFYDCLKNYRPETEEELSQWLNFNVGYEFFCPGQERVELIFSSFKSWIKNNEKRPRIITIGGTNGKGDVAFKLGHLLYQSGISCAIWSSPHIISLRERFWYNDQFISYLELKNILHESWIRKNSFKSDMSYYEFLFYVFWNWIQSFEKLDIIILEVGLGGRLDAVNVFDADICAITSIGRDHEAVLGRGYKNILLEKLGICRPKVPLISSLELNYCQQIVETFTSKNQIPWIDLFRKGTNQRSTDYLVRNENMANLLFSYTQKLYPQIFKKQSLQYVSTSQLLFGRIGRMTIGKRRFIFIGAHNLDGTRKMVQFMRKLDDLGHVVPKEVLVSFSQRPFKEVLNFLKIISKMHPRITNITVTKFDHPKAYKFDNDQFWSALSQKTMGPHIHFISDWTTYFDQNKNSSNTVLVCGSYYFIGTIMSHFSQSDRHSSCIQSNIS